VIKSPIFSLNYHDYLIIFLCNFHEISWVLYVRMSEIHMSHDILIWYSHEINISIYVRSQLISHDFFHDLSWDFSVRAVNHNKHMHLYNNGKCICIRAHDMNLMSSGMVSFVLFAPTIGSPANRLKWLLYILLFITLCLCRKKHWIGVCRSLIYSIGGFILYIDKWML
jgi:hypothetical protein